MIMMMMMMMIMMVMMMMMMLSEISWNDRHSVAQAAQDAVHVLSVGSQHLGFSWTYRRQDRKGDAW